MSLTACADMPIKPIVNRCRISLVDHLCYCNKTGIPDDETVRQPLEFCDGFSAHSPEDTGKMDNYTHGLENYIDANCKQPTVNLNSDPN